MPIRREFRVLYPLHWDEISRRVRFERAGGACERCGRPHGIELRCLPDGRLVSVRRLYESFESVVGCRDGRLNSLRRVILCVVHDS